MSIRRERELKKLLTERKRKKSTAGIRQVQAKNKAVQRLLAKSTQRFNPLRMVGTIPTNIPMPAKTGKYVTVKCKMGKNKKTKVT